MVDIASTSTHLSSSMSDHLIFGLVWWNADQFQGAVTVITCWCHGRLCENMRWECCETVPIYSQQTYTIGPRNNGWPWSHLNFNYHSYSAVSPSDFAWCTELLTNSRVVLAHIDFTEGALMVWDCCESVIISPSSLLQDRVTMVGLAFTSTRHLLTS